MRFMVMVRSDANTEAGVSPGHELHQAMARYSEDLARAGVLLAAEGLHPSARGARVRISRTGRTLVNGPFSDPDELIAGFWLIQARSLDEAMEWVRRCPSPAAGETVIEIRQVFDAADPGDDAASGPRARTPPCPRFD